MTHSAHVEDFQLSDHKDHTEVEPCTSLSGIACDMLLHKACRVAISGLGITCRAAPQLAEVLARLLIVQDLWLIDVYGFELKENLPGKQYIASREDRSVFSQGRAALDMS